VQRSQYETKVEKMKIYKYMKLFIIIRDFVLFPVISIMAALVLMGRQPD
jgi:hypothetical protein